MIIRVLDLAFIPCFARLAMGTWVHTYICGKHHLLDYVIILNKCISTRFWKKIIPIIIPNTEYMWHGCMYIHTKDGKWYNKTSD